MFRKIDDFQADWQHETQTTLRVLRTLTDASLAQSIGEGRQTLGGLAWHLAQAVGAMMGAAGVSVAGPGRGDAAPSSAEEIAAAYERAALAVPDAVRTAWSDEQLPEPISMFGQQLPRGIVLSLVVKHQAHHRGQMTVLMRQAGLRVPGCYGPSEEEMKEMAAAAARPAS
jgi:uncharacterized damage-inducible protein DinB